MYHPTKNNMIMKDEKFIINIGRQLGSGGKAIGKKLAEHYGISIYDKTLLKLAAKESGFCQEFFEKADEKASRGFMHTFVGSIRVPFVGDGAIYDNYLSNDALFKIQSDVIREIAEKESCIFVGRCADYILRNHPRCINIFICADKCDRIKRVCANQSISEEEAREKIENADKKRSSYYNYYSCNTWGAASTYHLCINSSVLGEEGTTEFIKDFIDKRLSK